MTHKWQIPRRTFLKGLGTCISLPLLEAMVRPMSLLARDAVSHRPLRMGFIYVPNGANMADWTPSETGTDFEFPAILEPLKEVRSELQVLTGLAHQKAFANGDGAGDHARANATFLTGCQARKTAGADIRVGVSVDQVAAARMGRSTRLPSLELSCDKGQMAGECDSGYACAYQFHLSWRSESVPNPAEVNPRQVFERLFGSESSNQENRLQRERMRKSVLDFALDDAQRLRQNLGRNDQQKLDEYLGSIRELELRLESAQQVADRMPGANRPDGIPHDYEEHIRLMFDLLILAFQTDSTRIATFSLAHDGSNRAYPFIGVHEGHHDLSHHEGKEEKKQKIARINRFHMTQFAYFLKRLRTIKEGEGSLLDNCMLVYGSGIADGNAHNHDNLPVLLAGRGAGTLNPGRHVKFQGKLPMANLYLAMLERLGVPAEHLGDSTGRLTDV